MSQEACKYIFAGGGVGCSQSPGGGPAVPLALFELISVCRVLPYTVPLQSTTEGCLVTKS